MEGGANPTSTGNVAQLVKFPLPYVQPHLTGGANPQEPERNPNSMHPRWQNGHTTNLTHTIFFSLFLFLTLSPPTTTVLMSERTHRNLTT